MSHNVSHLSASKVTRDFAGSAEGAVRPQRLNALMSPESLPEWVQVRRLRVSIT
jgi:hypothetical protein